MGWDDPPMIEDIFRQLAYKKALTRLEERDF